MKHLSDLTNLRELQLSCCKISDLGVSYLRGLSKLAHLNLEGCAVTAACLEVISGFASFPYECYVISSRFHENVLHLF
jgi:hypothetical protein